jgi:predicted N-formylglutamate amidohydrolase
MAFLVTCEHGGARVPAAHRALFAGAEALLASHRGWDPGAAPLARFLAGALRAPLHLATVTRLLVDLNRSAHNPRVFSERTRSLPRHRRMELLEAYHSPHRETVDGTVATLSAEKGTVVHLAVHTFTPVLNGKERGADVALLYDPARPAERDFCATWAGALAPWLPGLAVRRNQPYRGATDGLTTWLRSRHPDGRYLGVEIEVNQRLLEPGGRFPDRVGRALVGSLSGLERRPRAGAAAGG